MILYALAANARTITLLYFSFLPSSNVIEFAARIAAAFVCAVLFAPQACSGRSENIGSGIDFLFCCKAAETEADT